MVAAVVRPTMYLLAVVSLFCEFKWVDLEHVAATHQVAPPEPFNFKDWTKWIRRYERFWVASGLDKKSQEWIHWSILWERMQTRYFSRLTIILKKEGQGFWLYSRKERGSRTSCFQAMKRKEKRSTCLWHHCSPLPNIAKTEIYAGDDRILAGMRDSAPSLKLHVQLDNKLTPLRSGDDKKAVVCTTRRRNLTKGESRHTGQHWGCAEESRWADRSLRPWSSQKADRQVCSWCGELPPLDRQNCPAKDEACHKCSKRGHCS